MDNDHRDRQQFCFLTCGILRVAGISEVKHLTMVAIVEFVVTAMIITMIIQKREHVKYALIRDLPETGLRVQMECRVPAGCVRLEGQLSDPYHRRLDDADHRLAGFQNRCFRYLQQSPTTRFQSQQFHDDRRTFVSILIKQQQVK